MNFHIFIIKRKKGRNNQGFSARKYKARLRLTLYKFIVSSTHLSLTIPVESRERLCSQGVLTVASKRDVKSRSRLIGKGKQKVQKAINWFH